MTKVITAVMLLFSAIILFFGIFGERLYYATKPQVSLCEIESGIDGFYLPESAIFEENGEKYAYTIEGEPGFSMTIMRARRHKLKKCDPSEMYQGYVRVAFEDEVRERRFICKADKEFTDGNRVVESRQTRR